MVPELNFNSRNNTMKFLSTFEKDLDKIDGVSTSSEPPRYWFSTGNCVLNRIISGSFHKGIPQGRITCLAGPSMSGKSFLAGNVLKSAQEQGAFVLVVDSENALDNDFMTAIGVDITHNYKYVSVLTIPQVSKIVSSFIKGYRDEYSDDSTAPQVVIVIDSLDMLMTESEKEHYEKGETAGDQGQQAKQLKAMLRTFLQDIKHLNISIIVTKQVYKAKQDQLLLGEGSWVVNDAIRFSCSQIVLLTKLKLKGASLGEVLGIRMKCEGFKTRFAKPFQTVTIEVPYDTGMDKFSGLLDVALNLGVVERRGGWYVLAGCEDKWRAKDMEQHADIIISKCENVGRAYLTADTSQYDEDGGEQESPKSKRQVKFSETPLAAKITLMEAP